jgi:prevent-host-death family protein
MEVDIHEAETHFLRLLERVAMGEEVIIMKVNTPIARLVPMEGPAVRRKLGWAAREFTVGRDSNEPLPPDVEDGFYR